MKLNCKVGDLAWVVRSVCGNEGKIVRCLRFLPAHRWERVDGSIRVGNGWETDPVLFGWDGRETVANDAALRPIRDPGDDARDESWAYLPPVPTTTKKPEHA
jgi:hypothetical protein